MSYAANPRLVRASKGQWINSTDLTNFLVLAQSNPFVYQNSRISTLDAWGKIPRKAPFGKDQKFPEWETYVYIDGGDWPDKISQLISALNYRSVTEQGELVDERNTTQQTPQKDNGRNGSGGNGKEPVAREGDGHSKVGQNEMNKAELGYFTAIRRMMNQHYRGDDVYDKDTFESTFTTPK